jgi:hypothetical protein
MSEVQENTEAKLAAYIDGELEGAERAEIEKLLEQHPNYRRVLDQLRVARDLLRGLPRESAPPELNEAFNGQLERTVLLEGLGERRVRGASLNRWPQFAAMAAILLLTAGLGVVVFFVLPKGKPPLITADNRPAAGVRPQTQETFDEADRGRGEESVDRNDTMLRGAGASGGGLAASNPAIAAPAVLAENVYQNPQVQELLNSGVAGQRRNAPGQKSDAAQDALVVLVRSNDPQQVHQDLAAYCAANSIAWEAAPPRVQSALNSSLQNYNIVELRDRGVMAKRSAAAETNEKQQSLMRDQIAQTQPTQRETLSVALNDASQVDGIYVARNLSRRQAQDLSDALERQAQTHKDEATTRPANDSLPAMANAPVQAGQTPPAQQTQQNAANNVFRQQFAYWQSRNQAPATNAALSSQLAMKQSTSDKASPTQPASQPTDKKLDEAGQERERNFRAAAPRYAATLTAPAASAQPAPAQGGLSTTVPTTEPAIDEPVDVVIVVQRATDANPTTQPATTQPSPQ